MDYKIDMGGKLKTFHANLLKKYVERDTLNCGVLSTCAISKEATMWARTT